MLFGPTTALEPGSTPSKEPGMGKLSLGGPVAGAATFDAALPLPSLPSSPLAALVTRRRLPESRASASSA